MTTPRPIPDTRLGHTEGRSPEAASFGCPADGPRRRLFVIIFESDTPAGRAFDLALLWVVLASVSVVMLDSLTLVHDRYNVVFKILEALFTTLFTIEYLARLWCVERPGRYARSFFGIVDLLAVLPAYLTFFFPGLEMLINVRALRLLRVFRILKLTAYIREYRVLGRALRASTRKIFVFVGTVALIVILIGTIMYLVEGPENGFTSIPMSIYWAITTITTVGFGDITPQTSLGRAIASFMMLLGWGILAVPTGIVTAEITADRFTARSDGTPSDAGSRCCRNCGAIGHQASARYCQACGTALPDQPVLG